MHVVTRFFCLFFSFPTKKQRCSADWKEQVEEREHNHTALNEGNKKKVFCSALHSILKTKAPLLTGSQVITELQHC